MDFDVESESRLSVHTLPCRLTSLHFTHSRSVHFERGERQSKGSKNESSSINPLSGWMAQATGLHYTCNCIVSPQTCTDLSLPFHDGHKRRRDLHLHDLHTLLVVDMNLYEFFLRVAPSLALSLIHRSLCSLHQMHQILFSFSTKSF